MKKCVGLEMEVTAQHDNHVKDDRKFSGILVYNDDDESFALHDRVRVMLGERALS